jgi:hypothetical protein
MTRTIGLLVATLAACGGGSSSPDAPHAIDSPPVTADAGIDAATHTIVATGYPGSLPVPGDLRWVAYQDGDGAWQPATSDGAGTYAVPVVSTDYALAWVCDDPDAGEVHVLYATVDELDHFPIQCYATEPLATVSGTVSGVAAGGTARIALEDNSIDAAGMPATYSLLTAAGVHDMFAVERSSANVATRIIIRRDVDLSADATVDFDLTGATAVVTSPWTASEPAYVFTSLYNAAGGIIFLNNPVGSWVGVPDSLLAPDDVHRVAASDMATQTRRALHFVHSPGPVDFTLPPAFDTASIAPTVVATSPYRRLAVTASGAPDGVVHTIQISQQDATLPWFLRFTGARVPGGAIAAVMPDLSAVPGFDPAWTLGAGMTYVYATSITSNRPRDALAFELAWFASASLPLPPGLDGLEVGTSYGFTTISL